MIRHALHYASRGLRVLPIWRMRDGACACPKGALCDDSPGKHPIGALAPRGVHSASLDAATIREWWRRYPSANIAIAVPPEWLVVDVDPRNGGDVELARLEREHGALPPTLAAHTGGDGQHLVFARPPGKLRGKLARGIDLLGVGRYILVAPSVHPSGGVYRWTSPRGTAIAQPPAWLVDLARVVDVAPAPMSCTRATGDVVDRARKYLAHCAPAISGSGGHTATFIVASRLVRGFALDEGTALALLIEWNTTCSPPWSTAELARKIKQAATAGAMPIGALRDAARRTA